ncbi:hypothetical protein BSKO_08680 [Bryopsis sp. KO-2023]|nr:hypothetical protein BSKO_08680 [Bryopsis sp. KO-2023]
MVLPGLMRRATAPSSFVPRAPVSKQISHDVKKRNGATRCVRPRVSPSRAAPLTPGLPRCQTKSVPLRTAPNFQKAESPEGVVEWPDRFSLESFDAALEVGEVEACWQQILSLRRELQRGRPSHVQPRNSDDVTPPDFRSKGQLVSDAAGPGPSSSREFTDGPSHSKPTVYSSGEDFLFGSKDEVHTDSSEPDEPVDHAPDTSWHSQFILKLLGRRHKKFIQKCLRKSRRDLALEYVRLLPAQVRLFSLLMKECLELKDMEGLFEVLDLREEMGLRPDQYSYSAGISALGRVGDVEEARATFDVAVRDGIESIYVYNSMIDAYSRNGDIDGATEIWEALQQAGLGPDAVTYTGMIRGLGAAKRMDDVKKLLSEMLDLGLRPMPHTFTVVFDAAAECEEQDGGWLMSLCDVMANHDIMINRHILSALITSLSQAKLEVGQTDKVFVAVEEFRVAAGSPGAMVYSSLLTFCGRHGIPERAIDVWNAMQEDGVRPNCHIYSAALTSCSLGSQGDPLLVNFANQIGHKLRIDWETNRDERGGSMLIAFNSLVHACTSLGDMEQAVDIFDSMRASGPAPDSITYNTLMGGFAGMGELDEALDFMEGIHTAGLEVTGRAYVALLTACSKAQNAALAWRLFQEMVESGVQTSVEAYTAMMDACVKDGSGPNLDRAFELLDDMRRDGLKPTAVTYGCLLVACQRKGSVDLAFQMYREAHEEGILPTDECHNILINMCTVQGRLDEALELIKVLAWQHGSIEHHTLNSLVRALSKHFIERAIVVLRLMRNRGMEPTKETYHSLIIACSRHSRAGTAFELYKQMRSRGIKGSREVGSAVVEAVCQASEINTGLRIVDDMMKCSGMPSLKQELESTLPVENMRKIAKGDAIRDHSQLPDAHALGFLCCGLVRIRKKKWAMRVFQMIRVLEGDAGLGRLVGDMECLFESLIEMNCRENDVEGALGVFDIWKGSAAMVMANNRSQRGEEWAYKRHPRLSQASLAFLEATCQQNPALHWRMYDVCASMRQQREWAHEASLPRPPRPSYHFREVNT